MPRLAVPRGLDRRALRCRREFLGHFPGGYRDDTYLAWERDYKVEAHEAWERELSQDKLDELIDAREFDTIAQHAVRIESRTNLLFSFEKMALRDALRSPVGARTFALGINELLHGKGSLADRFENWVDAVSQLPRKQTRVLTWPVVTVFGMIGAPREHIFLKPWTTQIAAEAYGFDFLYESRPNWMTYKSLLDFAARVRRDTRDLKPRDMIDLQSFIWVLGSYEYD
ncbi:MAG TPA: hypothetical protein VFV99_08455 [Kofleriaceae bacterium]|nr:hypothetical protein [Kofleriaceae bacterium]